MSWVRLDDQFADHPKIMAAGPLASWLFVCGLTYCSRYLTDGFIPSAQVRKLADVDSVGELADRLVLVGLWEPVEGGYCVHDYLDYQPSGAQRRSEQQAARDRMSRLRSGEVRANTERTSGGSSPSPSPSPESRSPVPSSGKGDLPARENRARPIAAPPPASAPTPATPSSLSPSPRPIAQTQSQSQKPSKPAAPSPSQPRPQPPSLPDAREPPPRIDSALWTALLDGMGHSPVTRAERVGWGNWLAQLQEARASPDEIRKRCVQYRRCYGPEIPLTPKSLVEHWSEFDGQLATTATGQAASATIQALDVAANRRRAEEQQMADEKRRLAAQYLSDLPTTHGLRRQPAAG